MYITTFEFIFTSTTKPYNNELIVFDAFQKYNDGKRSFKNHYLGAPLRHIGVNCSLRFGFVAAGIRTRNLLLVGPTL